jgi:hypothetical protein
VLVVNDPPRRSEGGMNDGLDRAAAGYLTAVCSSDRSRRGAPTPSNRRSARNEEVAGRTPSVFVEPVLMAGIRFAELRKPVFAIKPNDRNALERKQVVQKIGVAQSGCSP